MTELTIDMANKMPFIDWVKHFRPDWTDEQCDFYLWEHTCFPFGLKELAKSSIDLKPVLTALLPICVKVFIGFPIYTFCYEKKISVILY
jgi:hypothetical protein